MSQHWLKKFWLLGIATTLIVVGITWFTTTQATATFAYRVTKLENNNASASMAYDINDLSQVVGSVSIGRQQSILWNSNGTVKAVWSNSGPGLDSAVSINNWGQVACVSGPGSHVSGRCPYIWKNGIKTNIGKCGGSADVYAINDAVQVVGSDIASPFVWKDGVTTPLSVLDSNSGYSDSQALGINNKGQIVGYSPTSTTVHAVLWNNGSIKDLGTLPGGNSSKALGINRQGQVVGWSDDRNAMKRAVLWENDAIKDLRLLDGNATIATSINNLGTVVGYSFTILAGSSIEKPQYAFVWKNGMMRNLNRLLPANSGWELNTARAINNRGQIVGEGKYNGQQSAYLLTPTWTNN
jgi:probable HAF family extracellular repeat protein